MKKIWKIVCLVLLACVLAALPALFWTVSWPSFSPSMFLRIKTRLARVWLPNSLVNTMSHVCSICADIFRQFIVGQTTEAVILGSLCGIGMTILRIPYAPMVGALVGVTALIPYVGAFIATIVGAFMILTVNPFKALVFMIT